MDREYLKRSLCAKIDSMDEEQLKSIASSPDSFHNWCREEVGRIVATLGAEERAIVLKELTLITDHDLLEFAKDRQRGK